MNLQLVRLLKSRVLLGLLGVVAALGMVLTFVTVWAGGIGWDAVFEVNAMTSFTSIESGQSLDEVRTIVPEQDVARGLWIFYLAQILAFLTGSTGNFSPDAVETYVLLGASSAVVVVLGSIAVSVVVWLTTRKMVAAVLTLALLFSTPLWVGMAGVAYRDAPIAIGLTLVASGLALLFMRESARRLTVLSFSLTALGTLIAVGSRAGAVALVAALVVVSFLPLLFSRARQNRLVTGKITAVLAGVVTGFLASVLINPVARLDPVDWIVQSVLLSQSNPTTMLVKVLAQDVMSDNLPLWYIPVYVFAQLPIATLAAIAVALLTISVAAFRRARPSSGIAETSDRPSLLIAWPFVVQGIFLPVMVIAAGSNIYDGLRHVLFLVPPLVVLIAMAVVFAPTSRWQSGVTVLAVLAVVLGSWATVRWFPYSYAHINPVAGLIKEPRIWELDYWGLSAREGVTRLQDLGASIVYVSPTANTSLPWGGSEPGLEQGDTPSEEFGWYVFERWAADIPQQCRVEFEIRRDGHLLGRGGLCAPAGSD